MGWVPVTDQNEAAAAREALSQPSGLQRVGPRNVMLPGQVAGQELNNTGQALNNQRARVDLQRAPIDLKKAEIDAGTAQIQQQAAMADLEKKRAEANGRPPLTADKRSDLTDRATSLDQFERELSILERSYVDNFRKQGPLGTAREYLPEIISPTNQDYNATGQRILPLVAKALGFSAQQMNTPAELARLESYIPKSTDSDKSASNKLRGLRLMMERQRVNINGQLGNAPQPAKRAAPKPVQGGKAQPTPRIKSDAEYNSLPSGTRFIAPDGTVRRKP